MPLQSKLNNSPANEPRLSIIIACYNCEKTLEEAVASVYKQNINIDYDVILVDDASTDSTRTLMDKLAIQYPHIKCFSHEVNLGGGATRNTAVESSASNIFFCLDSDDILYPGTLGNMVEMIIKKKCDGIGISTSITFQGKSQNNVIETTNFGSINNIVPFESLFQKRGQSLCSLYSTFMFTKVAFVMTGGYPTHHGFDTQGFAYRFLSNDLTAYVCPNSVYLHRINYNKSYYMREYESGKLNLNWLFILVEHLYLFSDDVKKLILKFDINSDDNIIETLIYHRNFLADNYRTLIQRNVKQNQINVIKSSDTNNLNPYDALWLAYILLCQNEYNEAKKYFGISENQNIDSWFVKEGLLRCQDGIDGLTIKEIEARSLQRLSLTKRGSKMFILKRIYKKLNRIINKVFR
ncbi:MAG: glycosyltransferase family 2 protein [Candidatus Taylorbacteria bacterium]